MRRPARARPLAVVPLLLGAAGAAWAFWSAPVAPGGSGSSAATWVEAGPRPAASATGSTVTVGWAQTTLADGSPVLGYLVRRYDAGTGTETATGSTCAGTVTASTCTETVPDGTWTYRVTPVAGTSWRGAAGDPSPAVTVDTQAPVGGAVAVTGLQGTGAAYATTQTLTLSVTPGSDPHGPVGARLLRSTATLTSAAGEDGACGSFGTPTQVATDPAPSFTDTVPNPTGCVRYTYVSSDSFGNTATATSAPVKVDTSAPSTPTVTPSAGANSAVSGSTVWFRPGVTGSFTVSASSTDSGSGVAAYTFPAPATGWTVGAVGATATYSFGPGSGTPLPSNGPAVTARNHAGGVSASQSFGVYADATPPTAGSVGYLNGTTTASRVSVTLDAGTDGGSGIATRVLLRASAPLVDGTCGAFSTFATVVNGVDPPSPRLDPVDPGFCYRYRYEVTDRVGNVRTTTGSAVTTVLDSDYARVVKTTGGLSSYWRLGEPTMVYDSFTGASGTALQSRSPDLGAAWSRHSISSIGAVLTPEGRLRRTGASSASAGAVYFSSLLQDTPDYTVEGDLFVASQLANDTIGLTARLDPSGYATGYGAWYNQGIQRWELFRVVQGAKVNLSVSPVTSLTVGRTYHVALDMRGSVIRLLVDGSELLRGTDSAITRGTAGVVLGFGSDASPDPSDTTGMQLDNLHVTPAMKDSGPAGATGSYFGPLLGQTGSGASDQDTAARFDGVDDVASAAATLASEASLEVWFRSTAGRGTAWRDAAGILAADADGTERDLGIALAANGAVLAGAGTVSVTSSPGLDDGRWHHVVLIRSSQTLRLFVDGAQAAEAFGPGVSGTTATTVTLGRGLSGLALNGDLDEVAVYSTALTPATVAAHHLAR